MESCALIIVQANNFVFKWPFNWCQIGVKVTMSFIVSEYWLPFLISSLVHDITHGAVQWWGKLSLPASPDTGDTGDLCSAPCHMWPLASWGHRRGTTSSQLLQFYRYYFLVMETYWHHLLRNHCLDISISIFIIYTLVKINSALIVACTGCPSSKTVYTCL